MRLILASASETRLSLLRAAGLTVEARPARIDEEGVRAALEAEGASPLDVADTLAELKARKIAEREPGALVLGCDQVLAFGREVWGKAPHAPGLRAQLLRLRGQRHSLISALVLHEGGRPVWRHAGEARLTMRDFSDEWLTGYIARNWESVRHSVGGYRLEEEGVRLFSAVEGDYFTILGLPLLPLLNYLGQRSFIPT